MPEMTLSKDEARAIVENRDSKYREIDTRYQFMEKGLYVYDALYREVATGRCWKTRYKSGDRYSDGHHIFHANPFDMDAPTFTEVEWKEVLVKMWAVVEHHAPQRIGDSAPLYYDGTSTPAHYELREASELMPSHDPNRGFVKNESYKDVSCTRILTPRTLEILGEGLQERGTLSSMLNSKFSDELLSSLLNDKALSEKELAGLTIKGTNRLNANGKIMIEAILLGQIIPDATLLETIAGTDTSNKLLHAISLLSRTIGENDIWNISKHLWTAAAVVAHFHYYTLEAHLGQASSRGEDTPELSPESRVLALALENMGQRKFSAAIAQYAKDAARAKEAKTRYELMPGILSKPKTPQRALMEAFGEEKPTPKVAPAQKEANRQAQALMLERAYSDL